ncbi:MAG: TraM recognition domain-containing protein [Boseongicola sp. SB0677_bin_26]|nr:TraM recognition domain-containing protein [Boseongicola sp. SB0665_bin_10]MYG25896.1 TraM recognition domain-containing protein [Boseongicola sp. SB0677_bin_26]
MRKPKVNLRGRMQAPDLGRVLPDRVVTALKRVLAMAGACAFAALMAAAGLPVLYRLYASGGIDPEHYHVAFALLCVLPAAAAHAGAAYSGARGVAWWLAWLPGLAIYYAYPWPSQGTWQPLWIFGHAWDWARTIFAHWDTAGPFARNSFGAFVGMATVTLVVVGKLWFGAAKAAGRLGPGAVAASQTDSALPSASWASRGEILKRFNAKGGIVLGEMTDPVKQSPRFTPGRKRSWGGQGQGELITMSAEDGNGHVLVTSQASGYKSTGLVIPNILTYDDPIVVFDPKCELYARTWKARKAMEFEPVVIDAKNGFDPARLIAVLAQKHPSAYVRMAKMLIPKGDGGIENAQYFKDAATNLFTALLAHYGATGSTSILQDIARVLAQPPNDAYKELSLEMPESAPAFVANEIRGLEGMDSKYWYSVTTEIRNQLLFCSLPDVASYITMEEGSKLPSQVIHPRCDIYLNIPQNVAEDFAPMLRVMLGSMLTAAELIEVNEAPRARRLFLIDEAAKLGAMDILENIRDRGRSRGLHLMMFYQTPGEIVKLWGRAGMTSWKDGCSAVIMGPVSSRDSAAEISAMIGTKTIKVKTESTSSSAQVMSPMGGSFSMTEQEQLRDVPLLSPTAVSQLPRHASIVKVPGEKAMLVSKAIWFTREDMEGRVRDTKAIKGELDVSNDQEELLQLLDEMSKTAEGGEGQEQSASRSGDEERPLSEQARARRPRPPEEATARPREFDPGEIRIDDDFEAPFALRDDERNGVPQPDAEGWAPQTAEDRDDGNGHAKTANAALQATGEAEDAGETGAGETPVQDPEAGPGEGRTETVGPPPENASDGPGKPEMETGAEARDAENVEASGEASPAASQDAGGKAVVPAGETETETVPVDRVGSQPGADEGEAEQGAAEDADDVDGGPDAVETAAVVDGSAATEAPAAPDSGAETAEARTGTRGPASEDAEFGNGAVDADRFAEAAGPEVDADDPASASQEPAGDESGTEATPSMDGRDEPVSPDGETADASTENETASRPAKSSEDAGVAPNGGEATPPALKEGNGPTGVPPESGGAGDAVAGGEDGGDWSVEESRRALLMLHDGVAPAEIARTLRRGLAETEAEIERMGRSAMVPGGRGETDGREPGNGP